MCNLYIIKMRRREREGKRWYIGGKEVGKGLTIIQSKDKCVVG